MINTFYGEFIKEKFPKRSRIRKDSSSTGGKLLDGLGTFIEAEYRSKALQEKHSPYYCGGFGTNSLGTLFETQLSTSSTYQELIAGNNINNATVTKSNNESVVCVKSIEELYNSAPEKYEYEKYFSKKLVIADVSDKNYIKEIDYIFDEETSIYINLKNISSTYKNKEKPYVKLCGKDIHGKPIEESIYVEGEALYKSKSKFFSLEKINKSNHGSGGFPVNIYGLKTFELEILAFSSQSFSNGKDYRNEEKDVKKKRIILKNYLSKSKDLKNIPDGYSDNSLVVELVNVEESEKSYFYYIHRHYKEPEKVFSENNIGVEKEIFETIIGFNLLEEYLADIEYCFATNSLVGCTEDGKIHYYKIGMPIIPENTVKRSSEVKLEIAFEESFYLPEETIVGRLITTNLDLPVYCFIVGKIENGTITFLNETKTDFIDTVNVFEALKDIVDLQDSIGNMSFDLDTNENFIEIFTMCFQSGYNNLGKINEYNLSESKSLSILTEGIEDAYTNSRVLCCGKNPAYKSYDLNLNPNFVVKNLYKTHANRNITLVSDANVHSVFKPIYNNYYYGNQSIYSPENNIISSVTFDMATGESIDVEIQ